ncbi:MAG: hypothetical protein K2H22_01500, partial [Muribaculaceae bacterium]|nr:hypothetical protein [Muribaculaceae bacterium]
GLKAQIEKLLADAKAQAEAADEETKRQNENLSAYNKVIATIDALEAQLKVTVAKIQAEFPEFEDEAAENLVKAELEALRAEANKAYLDVEKEGKFEFTVDQEAYEAKINKLYDDAKAKADAVKDEADRQKENLEAYNAAVADIDALQAKLDATVAQIQAEYAEYEDVEAEAAVQGQIDALREEAKKAYDAVAEAGKFDYAVEAAPVEAAIAQLLADAKAKAEAADAEAKRKADNEKAYNDVVASLDELEARYNEVVAEIKDKYAPYEDVEAENAVKETIDAYRDAAASALEAVAEAGNYNFTFDAEGLAAEIENLLEDAKAKSEDREARNKAAYDKVIDELNALRAEKDAAVEKILAEYPDYDPSAESRDIDAAIDALESGAYVAYLAVLVEGEYEFTYDPELIRSMISQMMDNAVGVEAIEAEVVAGNAYIFTLDGKQHQRPVHGEVNVIVRKNGERSKIFVK